MKLPIAFIFVAFLSATALCQTGTERVMPADFKTDGCTFFPDGNYRDCRVEHDKDYYFGGSLKERRASDKRLCKCVRAKANRFTAGVMWLGVRIGGVSFLPTPFRWGFGNKYPRSKPKSQEIKPAEKTTGR